MGLVMFLERSIWAISVQHRKRKRLKTHKRISANFTGGGGAFGSGGERTEETIQEDKRGIRQGQGPLTNKERGEKG